MSLRGKESETHPAADQQSVDFRQQRPDHRELVADLRPAQDDHVGPGRGTGQARQHRQLGVHQRTGGVRKPCGYVHDAGVRPVDGTEGVADVELGQACELVGERGTYRRVLTGLTGMETQVFQERDLTVAEFRDDLLSIGPGNVTAGTPAVTGERDRPPEQLREPPGNRGERVRRVRHALGPPQVGTDDHPGAPVQQRPDRGDTRAHPPVIGDAGRVA